MKPLQGWRDQRTGRVHGFQSEEQRENFMIGRARLSNGPNREMPRCTAYNRWASRARRRACAAGQPASATVEMLRQRTRLTAAGLSGDADRIQRARCDWTATGCASSGAAIHASPAGRSCWSPTTRRPVEPGQHGKVSNLMSSTAIFRHSLMRAGGYGRACARSDQR